MTEEKKLKDEKETQVPIITQIQNELKAPKTQYNSFGKYKYRNAEDIESAVKPLLEKYGAQLAFDEDYRQVGNRVYCVETAHYKDSEQEIIVHGWARESESKKGMDDSQISGSASSYATKYALSKLFLIDDNKDADSQKPQSNQGQQNYDQYPIAFNGTKTTMGVLMKHFLAKNKVAVNFANSLTGKDMEVFQALLRQQK